MMGFSELIKRKLGEAISYRYETYADYPHVPFPCLYGRLAVCDNGATEEVTSPAFEREARHDLLSC